MTQAGVSLAAVAVSLGAVVANIDPTSVEGWLKTLAYGGGTGLLGWQLIVAYKRQNELQAQLVKALQKCANCPLAQAANQAAASSITHDKT